MDSSPVAHNSSHQREARSQVNRWGLAIRNFFCWQPPHYWELPQPTGSQNQISEALTASLAHYPLESIRNRCTPGRFLENLAYLEWLDTFYQAQPEVFEALQGRSCLNWLDVGAKNWSYVNALDGFIQKRFNSPYRLDGLELDPNRRYANLTTRAQAARHYVQGLPQAQYHAMDALDWRRRADVISQFMPFVSEDPHLAWGLPLEYFRPQDLLKHLLKLLTPQGLLLVVNQGAWEAEAQRELWRQLAPPLEFTVFELGPLPDSFIHYQYPRYGWLCQKREQP